METWNHSYPCFLKIIELFEILVPPKFSLTEVFLFQHWEIEKQGSNTGCHQYSGSCCDGKQISPTSPTFLPLPLLIILLVLEPIMHHHGDVLTMTIFVFDVDDDDDDNDERG